MPILWHTSLTHVPDSAYRKAKAIGSCANLDIFTKYISSSEAGIIPEN